MYTKNLKRLGMIAAISIMMLMFATHASAGDEPEVSVCAPDWAIGTVNVTIQIAYDDGTGGMNGQFDLSFDPAIVKVTEVNPHKHRGQSVQIVEDLEDSDDGKINVEFSVPITWTVKSIVEVCFEVVGDEGESSYLDISGSLYKNGDEISANWIDDTVNIGSFDVVVKAPEYVYDTFEATIDLVDDVEDLDSVGFALSFDSNVVNVTDVKPGKISGTELPVDSWAFREGKNNTIIVNLNVPGMRGVSGSGTLATICFDAIGEDGDSSVLDIDEDAHSGGTYHTVLVNTEGDKLPINWTDCEVTIDSAAPPPPVETDTYVYVKNLDDDKLTVFLFIDGEFITDKDVSSGSTKKYSNYKLEEGLHSFRIGWYDLDTEKWYEKTKEFSVIGETALVVINTKEHTDEDTKISAHVYVKNLDDGDLDVYLYVDDTYKKYDNILSGDTCDYKDTGYEFDEEGVHSFKIKWLDPDTEEEYEKITRKYIQSEESVTLYVDKHTEEEVITTKSVSKPASTSSASNPAPTASSISETPSPIPTITPSSTTFHTDPTLSENSAGNNGLGQGTTWYTLIGFIAAVFAFMQIKRI